MFDRLLLLKLEIWVVGFVSIGGEMAVAELGRLAALGPLGLTARGHKSKAGELKFSVSLRTRRGVCRCEAGAFSSLDSGVSKFAYNAFVDS